MNSKINVFLIGISFFLLLFTVSAYAADVAKIGIIDFQQVLEKSSAGKAAKAEINEKGKSMEAELKGKGTEIEKAQKNLEREGLVMSTEAREKKEREIREMVNQFKALQKTFTENFKEDEVKLIRKLQLEVMDIVEQIGKEEGFLMILERRESGILYAPQSIDITDRIIQKYNANYAKKK
jgi:outer membrane protein